MNAQNSVGNSDNAPDASQVSSEQAPSSGNTTPQEITHDQLRTQLYAYYTTSHVIDSTMALAFLQVLPLTAIPLMSIACEMHLADVINACMINVLVVQPVNAFMLVLAGLAKHVDSMVPVANKDSSKHRRRHGWRDTLRWGYTLVLLGTDLAIVLCTTAIRFIPSVIPLFIYLGGVFLYFCVVLVYVCTIGFWDTMQRRSVGRRSKGRERAGILPVAEVGHELGAVQ